MAIIAALALLFFWFFIFTPIVIFIAVLAFLGV